jgi:hypothetical protein
MRWKGVDQTCIGQGQAVECCKYCNEPLVPQSVGNFVTSQGRTSFSRTGLLGVGWFISWLVGYLVSELERTLALDYEISGSHSTDHEE